ncbi:MAG: A/G-specific adenine glycosylase [Campylobacterales bacterium]|nr:A/G-specific adenine glycosylase [Campylobacterales bacterium]
MRKDFRFVHQKLLQWFESFGRHDLPWRDPKDVYHVYLSEVMLQQTQVHRVQEHYYPYFLEKYPTLKDLAQSQIEDLLASWSGLGYYSRARNMHKTANLCIDGVPDDMKMLQKLPGIGKYTASAICNFGFKQCVSVVDTNISRVIRRYFTLVDVSDSTVWNYADTFLNKQDATSHNLALMDLGAMVCTPLNPKCFLCPLVDSCDGKNDPTLYTIKKKTQYESMELYFGVHIQNGTIAVEASTQKLYNGLLTLPQIDPIDEDFIATFKHSYTKYKIDVKLYKTTYVPDEVKWIDIQKLKHMNISSLTKKALGLIGFHS